MTRGTMHVIASLVLFIPTLCSAQWQPDEPPLVPPHDPAKVVAFLLEQPYVFGCGNAAMDHHERIKPYRDRIAARPAAHLPHLSAAAKLPETIDECIRIMRESRKQPPPQPLERVPAQANVLARAARVIELSELLGPELAEPLLKEVFDRSLALHKDLQPRIDEAVADWRKRGGWEKAAAPEDRAECIFLGQVRATLTGMASRAIAVAQRLQSPVLVDPILAFYEAGGADRQSGWADYVLKCGSDREDVIPRLRRIADDPKFDIGVRAGIKQALAVHEKSLV